mmetsp:Transcript_58350/g.190298  ORF Transcript_58350/g.190298 Transcript_58350/m.190298 type:complete len:381 (-) Transcript_58350:527-1669(-)
MPSLANGFPERAVLGSHGIECGLCRPTDALCSGALPHSFRHTIILKPRGPSTRKLGKSSKNSRNLPSKPCSFRAKARAGTSFIILLACANCQRPRFSTNLRRKCSATGPKATRKRSAAPARGRAAWAAAALHATTDGPPTDGPPGAASSGATAPAAAAAPAAEARGPSSTTCPDASPRLGGSFADGPPGATASGAVNATATADAAAAAGHGPSSAAHPGVLDRPRPLPLLPRAAPEKLRIAAGTPGLLPEFAGLSCLAPRRRTEEYCRGCFASMSSSSLKTPLASTSASSPLESAPSPCRSSAQRRACTATAVRRNAINLCSLSIPAKQARNSGLSAIGEQPVAPRSAAAAEGARVASASASLPATASKDAAKARRGFGR